jgi:hypothetical protein
MSNQSENKTKTTDNGNMRNLRGRNAGYLISAALIVISVAGLSLNWRITPFLYLLTMIFLTITLWMPQVLTRIFESRAGEKQNKDYFNRN